MARVENIAKVQAVLKARSASIPKTPISVSVGFSQNYAIYVHENLESYHSVGQAKFLEQPARELAPQLGKMVSDSLARGQTLEQALIMVGLRIQREAQLLCPVDTGALRNSASTIVDRGK